MTIWTFASGLSVVLGLRTEGEGTAGDLIGLDTHVVALHGRHPRQQGHLVAQRELGLVGDDLGAAAHDDRPAGLLGPAVGLEGHTVVGDDVLKLASSGGAEDDALPVDDVVDGEYLGLVIDAGGQAADLSRVKVAPAAVLRDLGDRWCASR